MYMGEGTRVKVDFLGVVRLQFSTRIFLEFQECGINAQYTMASPPQQNGIANRRNPKLLNMVQCMLVFLST